MLVWIGAVVLHATALSAQRPTPWALHLIGRIGVAGDTGVVLGDVTDLALGPDGSVYVAEGDPARVTRYSSSGTVSRIMMRDGAGPGEVESPEIAAGPHDSLIVYDPELHRLTVMSAGGKIAREISIAVDLDQRRIFVVDDGRVFIPAVGDRRRGFDGSFVSVMPNGKVDTVTWRHSTSEDRTIIWRGPRWIINARGPYSPPGAEVIDRAGHIVIGGSRRSRWYVISNADTIATVALPDSPRAIPAHSRDSVFAVWFARLPKFPQLDKVITKARFPTIFPPWVTFDIDRQDRWWVGRPGDNGQVASWDIVDGRGILAQVTAPSPLLDVRFKGPLIAFGNGTVAMLHEAHDGTPWIGVYRIVAR